MPLPNDATSPIRPKRSAREGTVTRIASAISVRPPGASGFESFTSSAVHPWRRSPSAPPAVTRTSARGAPQLPNAFAHARSQTERSADGPVLANEIRSLPASANARSS